MSKQFILTFQKSGGGALCAAMIYFYDPMEPVKL